MAGAGGSASAMTQGAVPASMASLASQPGRPGPKTESAVT
jgi:hypothetical protein